MVKNLLFELCFVGIDTKAPCKKFGNFVGVTWGEVILAVQVLVGKAVHCQRLIFHWASWFELSVVAWKRGLSIFNLSYADGNYFCLESKPDALQSDVRFNVDEVVRFCLPTLLLP